MAEDDKYVPSQGNPKLDPTKPLGLSARTVGLNGTSQTFGLNEQSLTTNIRGPAARSIEPTKGLNGTSQTFGLNETKLTTNVRQPAARSIEPTVGLSSKPKDDNRGRRQGGGKKSDISYSMSPEYGQMKSKFLGGVAAGNVAGGLMPWISRFRPDVCGPVRVATFGYLGGVIQSNAQESANNGFPVKIDKYWGTA